MLAFRQMYRLDSIISNLIALSLCGFIAILLQIDWLLPHPAGFHHFLMVAIAILAAMQVIKSSKKSLLLPTICMVMGGIGLILHHFKLTHIPMTTFHLQSLMVVGSVGICIAVLSIK